MRNREQGVPYREPVIRAEYVGMREIAKRLGWSVNRVYREKRRNPMFPIFRRPTKEHWNYVMLEQRLQAWQLLTEMEATEHIRTTRTGEKRRAATRDPATGDNPPSGATGELGSASHEPTPAAQPLEESGVKLPELPNPNVPTKDIIPEGCVCGRGLTCTAHD
jgi:hypothetical protein